MAARRHHYERAFEQYLRTRRIPYVSVNDARKALMPEGARLTLAGGQPGSLKSFDFVVYGQPANLLLDVKGRKVVSRTKQGLPRVTGRLECWVTEDDIDSLSRWQRLFGEGFEPAFIFVYWCADQPPDALFEEIFEYRGTWYALRAVTLEQYTAHMKPRSPRWRTVDLPADAFARISRPFTPAPPAPPAPPVPPAPAGTPHAAGFPSGRTLRIDDGPMDGWRPDQDQPGPPVLEPFEVPIPASASH